ncbi:MAG TPA: PA2169 family four-helix-bundle protein [Bacteroidia bacterium]|jgi:uncharacterized protein (TIGR02284 family)|nr:PA2169 family four-helix-bundle protein [Bacteroidia bacterium]
MENNTQRSIEILTGLIEINNKRIVGYDNALKEIKESTIKCLFSRLVETSRLCKDELSTEVKKLGGVPKEETPTTSNLYKEWMDVKDAVASKNRRAIFNCCEFWEDVAGRVYEHALYKYEHVDPGHKHLIKKQYSRIKADKDKIKNLSKVFVKV